MERGKAKGISWKISAFCHWKAYIFGAVTENKDFFFAFETCSGILALGVFFVCFFNSNRFSLLSIQKQFKYL